MKERITLTQLRQGGHETFSRLFTLYYSDLVLFAGRYLPELESCEDIVQDTFMKVWHLRNQLEVTVPLRAYLIGAVRNRCLNEIKHRKLTANTTVDSLTWMPLRIEEEAVLYSELQERLGQALQKMPAVYREAFEMSRFYRMKYQEIADKLGVSKRTVEVRIGKALAILRRDLKDFMLLIPLFLGISLW